MSVIEKLAIISDTITKIMNFVVNHETVKPDFDEYLATLSARNADAVRTQALIIPYIKIHIPFSNEKKGYNSEILRIISPLAICVYQL